ncbi:DNA polymerase/3'-5' exonuclease PolX [Herpetosiphon llansteffanensis]|uniref:DNA polymerase/3'-5' exonuclease PolX n=1 Tax=Herpetosiphon llansteffanensis TaxID=2094568 RepID=UPI000D7BA5FD|nr:DNA polymerase/3'-5' exonuclease PolX [Herpetosiphon llansteffanensis]
MLSNQAIAQVFADIADALEVIGENRFRLAAYRRASDTLAAQTTSLASLREQGSLTSLPNIGEASAAIIGELLDHGHSALADQLLEKVPPGLLQILRVPEIGPKTAARLFRDEGIHDLEALFAAAQDGRLAKIKGFGSKSAAKVLSALEALQNQVLRLRLVDALPVAEELSTALAELPSVSTAQVVGSTRRYQASVGDLNFVVATLDAAATYAAIGELAQVAQATPSAHGIQLLLHNGMNAWVVAVEPKQWGSALVYWTGSANHVADLNQLAEVQNWQLDPSNLPDFADEAALYHALGLDWITPELREGWGEIALAQAKQLPTLLEQTAIISDLHWHTTWSDGGASLREMVLAGIAKGYRYMAVADHSAYLGVTGGLDGERLLAQRAEIDQLNQQLTAEGHNVRLLQSCEVDILPDGSLALPDEVLAKLDLVVASPHVALRQARAESTARMLRAINNPFVTIIGHPTGRILNGRAGADYDMAQIIAAAAATGTVLEVNAGPERLDLDAVHVRAALAAGCNISINTDAHATAGFNNLFYGVVTARRGGVSNQQVINTWDVEAVLALRQQKLAKLGIKNEA